jgi:uncharacterized membrane protein YidH (DUF202 family)
MSEGTQVSVDPRVGLAEERTGLAVQRTQSGLVLLFMAGLWALFER